MKIRDHSELFKQQDYKEQFERKKEFENCWPAEKVQEVSEWTKTEEYKELNFKRENIKINPAKACQPLGAVFCASGFEGSCRSCRALRAAWRTSGVILADTSRNLLPRSRHP